MPNNSYADYVRSWEELATAMADKPDLGAFEEQRVLLEMEVETFKQLNLRQATLRRQTQEASRSIAALVQRGRDMATRLRDSLRGHYGRTAEMLVEYRLQPRRAVAPRITPPPTPPGTENVKPSELGSTPARTAAPETDAST